MHAILNYAEIDKKIKSMSAHEIIMAMVEGLRKPRTEIDMRTFAAKNNDICFGCAATNAILHIINADDDEVKSHITYRYMHNEDPLCAFEIAIDCLRRGNLLHYNACAEGSGFAQITPIPGQKLPYLGNDYTEEQLQAYVKLAEYNK